MERRIRTARGFSAAKDGPIQYDYESPVSGVLVYHRTVYKSISPLGYGKFKKYQWTINPKNPEYFDEDESIVVNIRNQHQAERAELIQNEARFAAIGMHSQIFFQRNMNANIVFQAIFIGDYTPQRLKDTIALVKDIFGEDAEATRSASAPRVKHVRIAKELVKLAKNLVATEQIANSRGEYENFTGKVSYPQNRI